MKMSRSEEGAPVFGSDFDRLLDYLHDRSIPTSISPHRYAQVLSLDMQTLAEKARVHPNTISSAPHAECMQRYLRESLRIIRAATDVSGSVEKAIFWFKNNRLSTFDLTTPLDLVSNGRTEALLRYVQSLQAEFSG